MTDYAKLVPEEFSAFVAKTWNPRWLLWRLWADDPELKQYHFMAWTNERWDEFCKLRNRPRHGHTDQDQIDFDAWLERWVRAEIKKQGAA